MQIKCTDTVGDIDTEVDQMRLIATYLDAIRRKSRLLAERDPVALETLELAEQAAAVVAELIAVRSR